MRVAGRQQSGAKVGSPTGGSTVGEPPLTLLQLVMIFARTGALAFGGGGSTLAMLHREFCVQQHVLPEEEFQLLFGLSRLLPGMNLLSLTVLLGHRTHGVAGAVLSLVGLTVPSFALILLGCRLLRGPHPTPYLAGVLRGLSVGVAALLIQTAWSMTRGMLSKLGPRPRLAWLALAAISLGLARVGTVSPAWVVLGSAAVGVMLSRLWQDE
jgi:chromate transporter